MHNREWMNLLKMVSWGTMILYHGALSFGYEFPGGPFITLPIMCLGLALGAEHTTNEAAYLGRVLACALFAQIFWARSGLGGAWSNDLLGMWLGLLGVLVEKRLRYVGFLGVVAAACLNMSWLGAGLVYGSWWLRKDLLGWSALCVGVGVWTALYMGWGWLVYCLAGPLVALGGVVNVRFPYRLGRWVYGIYPLHFAGIVALKGVLHV